ncbi:superoxide dismutase family protein [Kribbella sp. NBC_01505]|uniref:superoxide dismutase family protein n=1 Tax=Kribbella sp. NBC_01505 TaxID=2903580 RepID=UPI0038666504
MTRYLAATTAVLLTAAVCTAVPAQAGTAEVVVAHGNLRDLQLGTVGPFDHASARVSMVQLNGRSRVVLQVRGIDRSVAGRDFGAHLHAGPCVTGDGAAAGPHYNSDTVAGRVPPQVDPTTEVWLDFEVSRAGTGFATTTVPFTPLPGKRAVVVHEMPTDHHGAAGPRQACLPVSW